MLLLAVAWRHEGKIHAFEARTTLLGLRRAASRTALHGTIVVSFGDNLAEVLSFERGRATDRCLNSLCRQSLSLQLASGIEWRRRYVETKRDISDKDSRKSITE